MGGRELLVITNDISHATATAAFPYLDLSTIVVPVLKMRKQMS